MKKIKLGHQLEASHISLGCMRMSNLTKEEASRVLGNALDVGVDFFDHADIYGQGRSEEIFSEAMKTLNVARDDYFIQTKTGIRKGFFDFSKEHIISSVEGSLQRLQTDYVDMLLLHRPDTLMEPEEVAEAFDHLEQSGKVRYFGVSNQNPMQIELLKKHVRQELLVNQLQFGLMHTGMIDQGFHVNMNHPSAVDRDGGLLEYSRLNEMTIQAWSPFQYGHFEGVYIDHKDFPEVNQKLQEIANRYGVTKEAIAIAWILRHPAKMQAIVGTMTVERLTAISKASEIELTREEWYELYHAAGNQLP